MSPIDHTTLNKMRAFLGDKINDILQAYIGASEQNAKKLRAAYESNDLEGIKLAVHTLKGSAGTIGALQVMSSAKTLEGLCKNNQPIQPALIEALVREIEDANQELRGLLRT